MRLTSLERVELLAAMEDALPTRLDERTFATVRDVGQLRAMVEEGTNGRAGGADGPAEHGDQPRWNRSTLAQLARRLALGGVLLPLTRVVAWTHVDGREHLANAPDRCCSRPTTRATSTRQ